jgi:4-alpha-glucanotransferase
MINFDEKLAGLLIPVFAMRRDGDLGIGDTEAVKQAIDFCARNNATVLQLLPINETGGDNSPYNAISSVALDPVLATVAPNTVPGLTTEAFNEIAQPALLTRLREGAVQYNDVKQLKFRLFRAAFDNFVKTAAPADREKFEKFKKEEAHWLPAYTLFRMLVNLNNNNSAWTQWPAEMRTPQGAEQWLAKQTDKDELSKAREFCAFVQWNCHQQWMAVRAHADKQGVGLMGDIPFGVSRYSADVWEHQDLFDLDWSGGAPPEPFFKDDEFTAKWGQNWGLPLYRWDRHREQNFSWWRQRVTECTKVFHYFRIDHVLGFFRIYAFPWEPERNGEFLKLSQKEAQSRTGGRLPKFMPRADQDPRDAEQNAAEGRALLEVILDAAGSAGVVSEDLGMVPDYVRPLLQQMRIPGFTIPYWERSKDQELKPKETLPDINLATYATHDHMPLVLFYEEMVRNWKGPDGDAGWLEMQRLMRFLGLDDRHPPEEYSLQLHEAFLRALFETPCWLAILMITELLMSTERFNQPGTSGESNWSRRLDHPLDWFEHNQPFAERIRLFARLVKETSRLSLARQVGTIR